MSAPLPPGKTGLPVVGETLEFAKDAFAFVSTRVAEHGRVFRTNILGQNAAIITGADAGGVFLDPANCTRIDSQPPHIKRLFNGESLPSLDGAAHRTRKQLVMAAFSDDAFRAYLPRMQRLIDRYLERWTAGGKELRWSDELELLSMHVVVANFFGVEDEAALRSLREEYSAMTTAFGAVPINLPGTKLSKGLKSVARLHKQLLGYVKEHRATEQDTGLARILAATADDGSTIDDESAARELHHLVVAGYIVFAEFVMGVIQLTRGEALRTRLTVSAKAMPNPLTVDALNADEQLQHFIMETKRITPVIPIVLGKSAREFEFAGCRIPKGWLLLWALNASHLDDATYSDPNAFDPERFAKPREEHCKHAHAFAPQGVGEAMTSHRCAGQEYSTMFMGAFFARLLATSTWTLPPQNLELDGSTTPPLATDRLRAVVTKA